MVFVDHMSQFFSLLLFLLLLRSASGFDSFVILNLLLHLGQFLFCASNDTTKNLPCLIFFLLGIKKLVRKGQAFLTFGILIELLITEVLRLQ